MTGRHGSNELFFAAGGKAGSAAGAALRRVRSLADTAPAGRLFSSIATLTDMTRRIETGLLAAGTAVSHGDESAATQELTGALSQMDRLAAAAAPTPYAGIIDYFRKRR